MSKHHVIEVRYHDSVNVLQEMFRGGAPAGGHKSPFDRPEWYALLAENGLPPLMAIADDGVHTAALPLMQQSGRITALCNWYSFTWRPLAPAGEAGDLLLASLARDLRQRAHRVTLDPVPDEDASATRLARAFAGAGWRVEVSRCDTNHVLHVGQRRFEEYWATRPGPLRTTLSRKSKKVQTTIHDSFDANVWAQYERIYGKSWKPNEGKPDMLRAFAKAEGKADRLRLGLAYHAGEAIAAQFWTVEGGVAYIHKLAHLESHRNLSAGTTLSAALFRHVIDCDRVELVDFGTGDEPYKADWMEATRPRYRIDCLDMRQPRAWVDLLRLALRRSRASVVPTLARLPIDG